MAGPNVSIQDVLGAPNMCGIIQRTKSGIPDKWGPEYYRVEKVCHGNTGQYTTYTGARNNATISDYGQPSKNRQLRELGVLPVTLIHSVENIVLQPLDYMNLIAYDDLKRQEQGVMEVTRQVMEARRYIDNLKITLVTAMMFTGKIIWDINGNPLTPANASSAYGNGATYQVPATNQGQLSDVFGNTIITAGWNVNTTDIIGQVTTIKETGEYQTGYGVTTAYYGKNIPSYMSGNTNVQAYLSRSQFQESAQGKMFTEEGELNRLLGINWIPAYKMYSLNANDGVQSYVGPDQIVFTPTPDRSWLGWLNGTYPVPKKANVLTSAEPALATSDIDEVAGDFAYGVQIADPTTVKIVFGTTGLPILKVPSAIFQAITVPGQTS